MIETARLTLRRPMAADLPAYTAYCGSDHSAMTGGPYGPAAAFDKLAAMIGHWELRGFGRLVFCDRENMRPLGHVGALQISTDSPPEMSWTLWAAADQGHGYAHEAAHAYLSHAKSANGFNRLLARIHPDNARSIALAQRLGGTLSQNAAPPWFANAVSFDIPL